jgi:anthranilate synthase component 1
MQAPFDLAADLDTPVSAYLKLAPLRPRFLLESAAGSERAARYSFLAFGAMDEYVLDGRGLTRNGAAQARPANRTELLACLRKALADAPELHAGGELALPFTGGLVGVLGYELARRLERLPPARPGTEPELRLLAPRALLAFDHQLRCAALLTADGEAERVALRREVQRLLAGPLPAARGACRASPPVADLARAAFVQRAARVREAILDGEVYQLVLSSAFRGRTDLAPLSLYRALRFLNPSPYMSLFEFGDLAVVGASPEALVRLQHGRATLQPIAGTRPRGVDSAGDLALERELLADAKEAAEHVMLVDLARNDLGRVARPGSIVVEPYRSVERYSHVMHLVSGVSGDLEHGHDAIACLGACFPAGTVVGAPKVRAMELIDELEPEPRGLYGGTVGYFDRGGAMDQALAIRTFFLAGDEYRFQAGAGIVAESSPDAEYDEILAKGEALRRALVLATEGMS